MVIDTSAIVAIAFDEREAASFEMHIANDPVRLISAATVFEASMVLESRLGEPGGSELDLWLHRSRKPHRTRFAVFKVPSMHF